jgi:ABC-type lipoprotein release transport system permease subunit
LFKNPVEINLLKTFSALYLWNEITDNHANDNYEVNMWWDKYRRIYQEFAHKKTVLYLKVQPIYEN